MYRVAEMSLDRVRHWGAENKGILPSSPGLTLWPSHCLRSHYNNPFSKHAHSVSTRQPGEARKGKMVSLHKSSRWRESPPDGSTTAFEGENKRLMLSALHQQSESQPFSRRFLLSPRYKSLAAWSSSAWPLCPSPSSLRRPPLSFPLAFATPGTTALYLCMVALLSCGSASVFRIRAPSREAGILPSTHSPTA